MKRAAILAAVATIVSLLGPAQAAGQGVAAPLKQPRLEAVHSFAFAIGSGDLRGTPAAVADRYRAYDLVIVDGQEATAADVHALRSEGVVTLGYLSVGTIEPFRPWYRLLKPYRLPTKFVEFGEWYANVDAPRFRRILVHRIAKPILAKGLDGLFLDNTDMIETHPHQTPGMRKIARALARLVHRSAPGRLLFAQNGQDVIASSLRYYDGWNREDVTWTYDFDSGRYVPVGAEDHRYALEGLRRIRAAGLLTLSTDYTAPGDAAAIQQSVDAACSAGALPFVSNIELTRVPPDPFTCP